MHIHTGKQHQQALRKLKLLPVYLNDTLSERESLQDTLYSQSLPSEGT